MPCNCGAKKGKKATLRDPDTGAYVEKEEVDDPANAKVKRKVATRAVMRDRRYAANGVATKELYYVLLAKKR